jgi:hypothetical protein
MSNETADHIEPIRRAIRNSAAKLTVGGKVEPIDAALGSLYATHDLALHAGMDGHAAIEWMRTGADLMERQLLAADAARHAG